MKKRWYILVIDILIAAVLLTGLYFFGIRGRFKKAEETKEQEVSVATLGSVKEEPTSITSTTEPSDTAPQFPEGTQEVTVVWVSDGDTYIVELDGQETTIRLIGVDTPESVASEEYQEKSGKKNTVEGKIASNVMKEKLPQGTKIYIKKGTDDTDDYGRTLVYAWFSDGTMIEDFLLENGYAVILEIEPNTEYAEHFRKTAEKAA